MIETLFSGHDGNPYITFPWRCYLAVGLASEAKGEIRSREKEVLKNKKKENAARREKKGKAKAKSAGERSGNGVKGGESKVLYEGIGSSGPGKGCFHDQEDVEGKRIRVGNNNSAPPIGIWPAKKLKTQRARRALRNTLKTLRFLLTVFLCPLQVLFVTGCNENLVS